MAIITSEAAYIRSEDVEYKRSVSENILTRVGASINYLLETFDYYQFGVSGAAYSGLSAYPYTFTNTQEIVESARTILQVKVFNLTSGTAGSTEFRIERQLAAGGSWDNIFSVNCTIGNAAADELFFTSDDAAPSGVTIPVLSITSLAAGDRLRFVLVSAATGARNLDVKLTFNKV